MATNAIATLLLATGRLTGILFADQESSPWKCIAVASASF
jgi:hypothetical protein